MSNLEGERNSKSKMMLTKHIKISMFLACVFLRPLNFIFFNYTVKFTLWGRSVQFYERTPVYILVTTSERRIQKSSVTSKVHSTHNSLNLFSQ